MSTDFNKTEEQPRASVTLVKNEKQNLYVSIGRYFFELLKLFFFVILFFTLSFHWMPDHGYIFPKEQLSFVNTVFSREDVSRLIDRHNEAGEFERALIRQEYIHRKMHDLGIIIKSSEE